MVGVDAVEKRTNPCPYTNKIPVPPLTSAWFWLRLQLQDAVTCNSNITGVATKISLLMYVEHEQPSYAAVQHVRNYMQFFPSNVYTHVICTHCDINGGRYTRHHLPNRTVTPLNSTNSCQQMAMIAIPPIANYRAKLYLQNGLAWLMQQTLDFRPLRASPYTVIANNENTQKNLCMICVLTVFVSTAVAETFLTFSRLMIYIHIYVVPHR